MIDSIVYNRTTLFSSDTIAYLLDKRGYLPFTQREKRIEFYLTKTDVIKSYTLDGYNKDWITTKDNVIRFDQIPAGKYKLRIRSSAKAEVILPIEIPTSIIETWWFSPLLTVCILLIPLFLVYFAILNRSRQKLHVNKVRNQISSDLHDHVGADLSAIKNHLKNIERKIIKGKNPSAIISKAQKYIEEIILNLKDTVWTINPNNENISELFFRLQAFSKSLFIVGDVEVVFDNAYDVHDQLFLDMEQRYNLLLIFKEVLNNAFKHAQADRIIIKIWNVEADLHLEIEDNGIGFDPNLSTIMGNGLENFENRALDNHIDIFIDSTIGKGTKINLIVHSL